jgi:hypothetical protein
MNQFLYYIPGDPSSVAAAGLAYAFECEPTRRGCLHGPDGGQGVVASADDEGIGYYKDRQTWVQIPGSPCWLGWYIDRKPGPTDLARKQQLPGVSVRLGDENDWLVVRARRYFPIDDTLAPACVLPCARVLHQDGSWTRGGIKGKYKPLWDTAKRFWDAAIGADSAEGVDDSWVSDACAQVLGVNYRLCKTEAFALDLLDDETCTAIMRVLCDIATFEEWYEEKKKTGAAVLNGDSGPQAETPSLLQQ